MLMAQDVRRAAAFWQGAFELRRLSGDEHWMELSWGGAVIALHDGHDGSLNQTGLSLEVDNIHAAAEAVRSAGGSVPGLPRLEHEIVWLADCVDTEGNAFMLSQPTRP